VVQFGATAVSARVSARAMVRRPRRRAFRPPMHPPTAGVAPALELRMPGSRPSHPASGGWGRTDPSGCLRECDPAAMRCLGGSPFLETRGRIGGVHAPSQGGAPRPGHWHVSAHGCPALRAAASSGHRRQVGSRFVVMTPGSRRSRTADGSELLPVQTTRDDVSWECRHRFARAGRARMTPPERTRRLGRFQRRCFEGLTVSFE